MITRKNYFISSYWNAIKLRFGAGKCCFYSREEFTFFQKKISLAIADISTVFCIYIIFYIFCAGIFFCLNLFFNADGIKIINNSAGRITFREEESPGNLFGFRITFLKNGDT